MMRHLISPEATKARVAKWLDQAKPIENSNWVEKRLVIEFGGHTYPVVRGQVFQCPHCGHFDPDWIGTEVLDWFLDNFGIKPIEIEVVCSVARHDEI